MEKFKRKIMDANFPRLFRRLLAAALVAIMLTGGASAALLSAQVSEAWTYKSMSKSERAAYLTERGLKINSPEQKDAPALVRGDKETKAAHKKEREEKHLAAFLTPPSMAAKIALAALGLALAATLLTYWLLSAAWLSQVATLSGLSFGLWLTAGLIGNVLAAALFFSVRRALYIKCPKCGLWHFLRHKFCKDCGAPLKAECPDCGEASPLGTHFCKSCGKEL